MAKVNIPVDLTNIKPTVALGLTGRQLKFTSIGFLFAIITYFSIRSTVGDFVGIVVFCLVLIPISVPGFFDQEKGGISGYLKKVIRQKYYYKQVRYLKERGDKVES